MATELGQAYVQIMPSAKGISGSIKKQLDPESASAGKSAGGKIATAIKGVITVAAIGKFIGKSLTEGAKLEQSLGGVETLFKGHADKVKKNASEAYRTAGVSANDYMENVTSFSASLLQSMGGNTEKAADKAHMAMVDMSDNANKFGTDMRDIQNAYQGFAKENYTMLDNLKLGYGGTKSEMERLLADATKLTGVKYDINNLADVYDAIHVVQDELGVTGTTAIESAETFSGSLASMKASFSNFLGNLSLGKDVGPSLSALASTISTFLFDNLLPMVGNIITSLPGAITTFIQEVGPAFMENGAQLIRTLADGLVTGIPAFFETMAEFMGNVVTWIQEQLPTILKKGVEFITEFATGIFDGAPGVIDNIGDILNNVLTAIFDALPLILESGMEIISNLAKGIWDNLPEIVESIGNVLGKLIDTIVEKYPEYLKKGWEIIGKMAMGIWNNLPEIITTMFNLLGELIGKISERLPEFLAKGIELVAKMAFGLVQAIPDIVAKVPQLIGAIVKGMASLIGDFVGVGADIVKGLWKGINSVKDWILGKISGFVSSITSGIKSFFGISSPSKVMADEVGKWLPIGLAEGIEDNIKPVSKAMEKLGELTTGTLESQIRVSSLGTMNVQGLSNSNGITQHITINSPTELSPSETARQVKNASRNLAMEW